MKIKFAEKQSFVVIGRVGQGFAKESYKWISPLWQEANSKFNEISKLVKLDSAGNIIGIWGVMSDIDEKFNPWNEQGKYLAGWEVMDDAAAPGGWTKWVIPAYKYVVVKCTQNNYGDIFNHIINEYIPEHKYTLVGAVHEFYNPKDTNNELYLWFPIEKL